MNLIRTLSSIIFIFFFINLVIGQNYIEGNIWIEIADPSFVPNQEGLTQNQELNKILKSCKMTKFKPAFEQCKNERLKKIFEIEFTSLSFELVEYLKTNFEEGIPNIIQHEVPKNLTLYDPDDYMWQTYIQGQNNWLWYLDRIEADKAWDITRGDESIVIAIIDTDFNVEHNDLKTEFISYYDPYDNIAYDCDIFHTHGTSVAGFASGHTTENGESTMGGQIASVGFNTKMIGYKAWSGNYLQRALHASNVMKANILTSSAGGWSQCPPGNPIAEEIERLAVKEILDNGTTIIMPAGNGVNSTHANCGGINGAFFPLSPYYDERVIIISGTDMDDKHAHFDGNGIDKTQSHFPEVDLCAPGHNLMHIKATNCDESLWQYSGAGRGTSFASPMVAGVASLILSVSPCLQPHEVQEILKSTTDPIADEANFSGLVGTGRVNAYKAVLKAKDYGSGIINQNTNYNNNEYLSGNIILTNNTTLTISSAVRIGTNTNITIENDCKLILNNQASFHHCDYCNGLTINVAGRLDIDAQSYLELTENSTLNIYPSGIVNITNPNGFCINQGSEINIKSGGSFFINGTDYTNTMAIEYNNVYNKDIINQNISGNHYALNKIETSGIVQTSGNVNINAGRRIIFNSGFSSKSIKASIDNLINNCEENICIKDKTSSTAYNNYDENNSDEMLSYVEIFPNPNNGQFSINIQNIDENAVVDIYDITGKIIFNKTDLETSSIINISNHPKGIYLVRITLGNEVFNEKIILQ